VETPGCPLGSSQGLPSVQRGVCSDRRPPALTSAGLTPIVTAAGLDLAGLLGGAIIVESVFTLPGLGRLAYESVVQRDLNTLLGIVFVSALLVISINFVVDILYARLDPRISSDS
jgi:peptide/nickel transport system permease protein